MKKLFLFTLMVSGACISFAQSLEDIGKLMEKSQYATAKTGIDKYIADPKNASSAEAWYYKGRIYNSLSRDTTVSSADAFTYKLAAYDAFKKNQQFDKIDIRMKTEMYKSYLDLYLGLYDLGAQYFNAKNYSGAYNAFLKAQDVESFIISKNYTYEEIKLNRLDTALVMNIAAAALQSGDTTNAITNYRRITDAGIVGAEYERVYEYLANYYLTKNDDVNAQSILAKGKAAYPTNNYWAALEVDKLAKSGDKVALLARYDEMYNKDPKNFESNYNYSVEMYNSLWASEAKNVDTMLYTKLASVLKSTIEVDKGNDALMLLNNHLFNIGADYSTKASLVKGTKPADLKLKKELNASALARMDELIPYAERALKFYADKPTLTTKQKISYQLVAGYLSDIYRLKMNPKKTAEYEKIRDGISFK